MEFNVGDIICLKRDTDSMYTVTKVSRNGNILEVISEVHVLGDTKIVTHKAEDENSWKGLFIKLSKEEQDFIKYNKNHPNKAVIEKIKRMYQRRKEQGYAF